LGIIRDRFLTDFDAACITLSRTVSTRFVSIAPGRNKRSIGASHSNGGRAGRGRGRARGGGRGSGGGRNHKVTMNGVDVTDVSRNYTSEEWEKLKQVGGHTYVYQRRDFLSGRGGRDGRGGRGGRDGGGGRYQASGRGGTTDERSVAATTT
jgi:hypothetical protein